MQEQISVTGVEITSATRMFFVENDGLGAAIDADLSYRASDPYAASIVFRTGDQAVAWTFGRDLLIRGIHEPAGIGDVQVWPCLADDGSAVVVIELSSPDGCVMVQASSRDVSLFVQQMLALVPTGTEFEHLDLDSELAALL